jgi:hypothetical protein
MMFFGFATETTKNNEFFGTFQLGLIPSSLLCVNISFHSSVKAMISNSGSDETVITAKN